MSNRRMTVYVSKDLLETVGVLSDDYPKLHWFFSTKAEFIIDITDEELDSELSDSESDFAQIYREFAVKFVAGHNEFVQFKSNPELLAVRSRTIYFLDEDDSYTKELTQKYGVLVYPQSINKDIDLFPPQFTRNLIKGNRSYHGWSGLLPQQGLMPRNSIVINDRHLFDNDGNRRPILDNHGNRKFITDDYGNRRPDYEIIQPGSDNVIDCLKALIPPPSFEGTFQVTIICKYPSRDHSFLTKLGNQLITAIHSAFNSKITVELFFMSDTIHKRRIFTNYQTIKCDKGFGIFNNNGSIREDNEFCITPCFFQTDDGDSQFFIDSTDLKQLYNKCNETGQRYHARLINNSSDQVLIISDNGNPQYTTMNRLMTSADGGQ